MSKLKQISFAVALLVGGLSSVCARQTAPSNEFVLEAKAMNKLADPCKDFYEYANGTWIKNTAIPADRSSFGAFDEVTERNLNALRDIALKLLEKVRQDPSQITSSERIVGTFFASGMNEEQIEKVGLSVLDNELNSINQIRNKDDLFGVLAQLHQLGVPAFFGFGVDQDAKNSNRYIAQWWQNGLGLPERDYYLKQDAKTKDLRAAYHNYIQAIFKLTGSDNAQALQQAKIVLNIETQLAKASLGKVELRDPQASYHLQTLKQLEAKYRSLPWQTYLNKIGVSDIGEMNLAHPKFVQAVDRIVNERSLAEIKVYLRWHLLNTFSPHLSAPFAHTHFDFHGKTLLGKKEMQPRFKRVLAQVDNLAGEALGQLYVAQYFPPSAKADVEKMVANIRIAMGERLSKLEWMSDATKTQAYKKLEQLNVKIGYLDRWRDYSGLNLSADNYVQNIAIATRFEFQRNLAKLGKPVDRDEWVMTPHTVNAYYNPLKNEMVFPAGILQPPLYHLEADIAANYGNTGATIGHELIHGFDDEGRQFDADGNLKNWWTKEDNQKFLKRIKLIVDQFGEFKPIDNIPINGALTAGENIADIGGLQVAFQAMEKALKVTPQAPKIDGLTPAQRFFVANAQSFRNVIRDEALRLKLATDPHAPDKYRILAPIANLQEFTDAFECKGERAILRPAAKRVNIW